MSETYVIGDVHGCVEQFEALLNKVDFRMELDRLWLIGDIINRGPASLAMLRRAIELEERLGERFAMVLGNHEFHLMNVVCGLTKLRGKDTLNGILEAHDLPHLIDWLRGRSLAHVDGQHLMVHAGFKPDWSVADALELAREAERRLQHGSLTQALQDLEPNATVATLTRVRMFDEDLQPSAFNGSPEEAVETLKPWFELWTNCSDHADPPSTVVFGHWAALGHRRGGRGSRRWISLDTGCVYGRQLSALRLSDQQLFSIRR